MVRTFKSSVLNDVRPHFVRWGNFNLEDLENWKILKIKRSVEITREFECLKFECLKVRMFDGWVLKGVRPHYVRWGDSHLEDLEN